MASARSASSSLAVATSSLRAAAALHRRGALALAAPTRSSTPSSSASFPRPLSTLSRFPAPQSVQRCHYSSSSPGGEPSPDSSRESAKARAAIGPFNLRAGILFLVTGAGLLYYFQREKAAVEARRIADTAQAKVGRPRIGGPFSLVTSTSHPFTHADLEGSFSLVYFGFTNCPDICPEELDKMGTVVDRMAERFGRHLVNPVFVSCDPARDTVEALARYIDDFHPRMVGLTGTFDEVKRACKAYRVYFSTPPDADPNGDYLVDHSIFFYLMDPEGKFVDAFGRSVDAQETGDKVEGYIKQWIDAGLEVREADARTRVQTREKVQQVPDKRNDEAAQNK